MKPEPLPNRPPYALAPEDVARLPDIRSTDEYRHQCEVRLVLSRRHADGTSDWCNNYFALVEKKRGKEARDRLEGGVRTQWKLGNRGKHGDWRVAKEV